MVIVCPECSTKFRVKSERIPEKGAKVRCARCQHVFLVQKQAPEAAAPDVIEAMAPAEETTRPAIPEPAIEQTVQPTAEIPQEGLPQPVTEEAPRVESEPEPFEEEESSFSYDQFRELDASKDEEESFTFGADEEEPTDGADEAEESFSFSGPTEELAESPAEEEPETAAEVQLEPQLSPDEKIAETLTVDEPVASGLESEAETHSSPVRSDEKKSNPASSVIRVLLLLILGLAIIAGALYYINGPEQIEQAIEQLFGQQFQQTEKGQISLSDLEGKFVNNQEAGELFVIRGAVTNNYREPRASIQVKGIIFDQNGKQLLQKTIFCGNPISDQELQTLPFSKLEEMMRNQFGKAMNNMKVNYKETIPFAIAFNDLPKNLSEFSVNIASSEPAK